MKKILIVAMLLIGMISTAQEPVLGVIDRMMSQTLIVVNTDTLTEKYTCYYDSVIIEESSDVLYYRGGEIEILLLNGDSANGLTRLIYFYTEGTRRKIRSHRIIDKLWWREP